MPSLRFKGPRRVRATHTSWRSVPYDGGRCLATANVNGLEPVHCRLYRLFHQMAGSIRSTRPDITQRLVEQCITRHDLPEQLMSDQGKNFLLLLIQEVCK